jgi:hypothetical protein
MNLHKLQQAEAHFFQTYPGGFEHPEMLAIAKKHKMEKMIQQTQEMFARDQFGNEDLVVENLIKTITRSTMVSLFEKPKFRDQARLLAPDQKTILTQGYKELLHGNEEQGFEMILDVLIQVKLAKWSLISVVQTYFRPDFDVFVKPTTAKGVVQYFELTTLEYKPRPSWAFYKEYRDIINEMKSHVDPQLAPYNAAFSGFLMMSLERK